MRIDELLKVANAEQQSLLKERVNGLAKNGANISMDTYIDFFKALLEHMQTDLSNADDSVLADFETIISAFASHIINNTHSNANLTVSHKIALNLLSKAIMVVKKTVKKEQILEYTRIFLEWKKSYLNPNQHFLALKTAPAPEAHKPSNIANTIQEEKNIMRKQNDNPENAPLSPEEVKAYLTEAANEFYKQHQETPEIQRNKDGNFDFYNTFYWSAITKPGEKFDDEKKRFMPKFVIIIRPPQNIYAHGEQLFQHLKKIFIKANAKPNAKSRIIFKSTNPRELEKNSKFSMTYGTKTIKRCINLSDYPEGTIAIFGTHIIGFLNAFYSEKPDLKHQKAPEAVVAVASVDNLEIDSQKVSAASNSLPSENSSLDLFAQDIDNHRELFSDIPELAAIEKQIEDERQRREGLVAQLNTEKQQYIEQRKQSLLEKLEQERRATQETESQLSRMRGLSLSVAKPKSPSTPSLFSPAASPQVVQDAGKKREAEGELVKEGDAKKLAP